MLANALIILSFFLHGKGFVSKLDEFIHWLNEAMETTENWTPPKAETDSLKLYLETHLVGQDYTMIAISNLSVLLCFLFDYYFLITSVHLYFNVRFAALQFILMKMPTNYFNENTNKLFSVLEKCTDNFVKIRLL